MRIERAQTKKRSKYGLVGAVMGLALAAGALLSMEGAPTRRASFFIETNRPEAAESASITSDRVSPREEIAESDSLDLQLD